MEKKEIETLNNRINEVDQKFLCSLEEVKGMVYAQNEKIAELNAKTDSIALESNMENKHIREILDEVKEMTKQTNDSLREIKDKPAARWETLIGGAIGTFVSILVAFLLSGGKL